MDAPSGATEIRPKRKWLVTRIETVKVEARNEEVAIDTGVWKLDFVGPYTSDVQVEEDIDE